MATPDQREHARLQLLESLQKLLAFKNQDLVRTKDIGTQMDFSSGAEPFNRLLQLYEDLTACPLEILSLNHLQNAKSHADGASQILQQVRDFRAEHGTAQRDSIIASARDAYDTHLDQLAPIIAYAYAKGTDLRALERQVRETAQRMTAEADAAAQTAGSLLEEVRAVLRTVREAAAQVGVAHHATNFADEARLHETETRTWLNATIALGVIGILVLLALFVWPFPQDLTDLSAGHAIYAVASRVLVFSVLTYALLWASRNYMAHRHNVVVNKHRTNALTTFETFVKAAGDDKDVKSAVLLQAAQCIFTPQPTGYLSREPMPTPPRNFVEVIQKAVSPASDDQT